ncbi:MAG: hypothetical protein K6A92_11025 [Lachnospiraceae bacterium]|nr:hypothetical protein [Lachnospiraceae bacterium]
MNKKYILYGLAVIIAIVFILMPFPASGLTIGLNGTSFSEGTYELYYRLDEDDVFSADKCIKASITHPGHVVFKIPSDVAEHITGIRMDLPMEEHVYEIRTVEVGSAGVIKRNVNPVAFFDKEHIEAVNAIGDITPVPDRRMVYLSAYSDDPYVVLSDEAVAELKGFISHFRASRLLILLLTALGILSYKKRFFTCRTS